jgi:glycogen debranching enzyme
MDTSVNGSNREGARVEIQALYLCALELKIFLRKLSNDKVEVSRFRHKLRKKKTLIRAQLVKNKIIHDGFNNGVLDATIRPNVFLAYYAYSGLAMKHQWEATFNHVLKDCFLEWGGVSSIGKSNSLFRDTYSGMTNESYHHGDSWFFVNNIAANVLYDFGSKHYKKEIKKIKEASIQELLYKGFIGYCAEVSSAKMLESRGCLSQAWSNATLLELLIKTRKF